MIFAASGDRVKLAGKSLGLKNKGVFANLLKADRA